VYHRYFAYAHCLTARRRYHIHSEHIASLARNKLQPDNALGEETERYWISEIATKRHQFSSLASEISALQTVKQKDIVALCKDWFGDSSSSNSSNSSASKSKSKAKGSKVKALTSKNSTSSSGNVSSSTLGRLTVLIVGAKRSVTKETAALQSMFSGSSSSELTFVQDIHAMRSQNKYYPVLIADT
jgi:hypothetical protein